MKVSPRYEGTPVLWIEGAPGDQREPVARQRRRMETLLAGLDDDGSRAPSRCDQWTVQDVIAHLVSVNGFWETSVSAGLAGTPTRMLAAFDPVAHPEMLVDGMRSLAPQEVFEQFVASNDRLLASFDTLDDAGWTTLAESPAGHVPIRLLAQHALWDAWIHERDIALPLGHTPVVEPDEARSCLRFAAAIGPALTIDHAPALGQFAVASTGPDATFVVEIGASVALRDGAPATGAPCLRGSTVELVEALSMRGPMPADAPDEWYRVLQGIAKVFDTELEPR